MAMYNGAALLHIFGGVEPPAFRNLEAFIFTRSMFFIGPLLLIPIFIPKGGPSDQFSPDQTGVEGHMCRGEPADDDALVAQETPKSSSS